MLHAAMEKGLVNLRAVMDQTGGEVFNVQDVSHLDETFRALIERIKTRYNVLKEQNLEEQPQSKATEEANKI